MTSARYVGQRMVVTAFLLWLVVTVLFFFFRLMPGDITDIMLATGVPVDAVAQFEIEHGLNDPLHVQYGRYLWDLLHADVGHSVKFGLPIIPYIKPKILNSAILAAPAITLGYIGGSVLGVLFGNYRGSKFERRGIFVLMFIGRFPSFFLAIVLIIVFSSTLNWFPPSGVASIQTLQEAGTRPWWYIYTTQDFLVHYTLPFLAIFLRALDTPALLMRTSVVEVRSQDFFRYMKLTGLGRVTRLTSLARHASLPVITLYPVALTRAIGGVVLVETVFNWPGIGFALVEAVLNRDFPVVQFVFILIAAFIIISNFVVDITYSWVDPRVTVGQSE